MNDMVKKLVRLGIWIAMGSMAFSAMAAPPASAPANKAQTKRSSSASHQQNSNKKSKTNQEEKAANLGKFTVHGHKPSKICMLEMLKLALNRSYTPGDPSKANELVCRMFTLTGTHIKANAKLMCETNAQKLERQRKGNVYITALQLDAQLPTVNRGKLRATLASLPDKLGRTCFEPK